MTEQNKVIESEKDEIISRECRFVIHVPKNKERPDLHLIKERVHWKSGRSEPRLRWIKNFTRPFWITNKNYQTHKQKKEVESIDRLTQHNCTQSDLRDKIATALGFDYSQNHIRKLANSPYLYGTEIGSQAIIKHQYQTANKTHNTQFSVMMFDIETDMLNGTQEPIITTAAFGNELYIGVTKDFIKGIVDPETNFREKCIQYISEFTDISKYVITYIEANGTVDLIRKAFDWIHIRKPDFLAIWNIDFDIPKILDTLKRYGVDPRDILCDPSVPEPARLCQYKEGLRKKRKANGAEYPIDYADQWHSLLLTASFYVIDAMCVYRLLRLSKQKQNSYGLDATLDRELGVRKLNFKEAEVYKKDRWHIFMQKNFKIEYMVYALFDSLSMKLLDDKTLDLCFTIPSFAGDTHFAKCNSKPKMIADMLHFFALERGYVLNSVGEQKDPIEVKETIVIEEGAEREPSIEGEPETLSLLDWIMTLPAHLVVPGLPLVYENLHIRTKLRAFVYDSDCVSAYPTCTSILNVSKSTTKREIVDINGIEESVFRRQNINLCSGYVNSLEYGKEMFGLPNLFELNELID